MKKIILMAIAMMALMAVSCQKEKDEELPIFTAHADNGGVKTDLVGNLIHWNNTDQVKVFGDFGYAIYGVSPRGDDPTWATLSPIENHGITGFLPYRFIYPASMAEGGTANNVTLYVNFPAERSISDAPLTYFPMYGESDHRDVAFRNLGGLVKLVMPEIDRQILQIRISTDEPNNGKYRIDNDCGLEFSGMATDETKCVTIQALGRTFAQGDCVYIAMPANEYHHFTIEIIADGQRATKVATLIDVLPSAITTITLSNLNFIDPPAATLIAEAFRYTDAESIIFHYNYSEAVPDAVRIDRYSNTTPIYKKIINNVCHVYTPASEIYAMDCRFLFVGSTVEHIYFGDGFNTSNVWSMYNMFRDCSNLTDLDLSSFNTLNVTNMMSMFYGCSSLTSLDLSSFNTSNVTDMQSMFSGCSSLTSLDLSSFNTSNVRTMSSMFRGCSSLTSLDLSSFNTSNLTHMNGLFSGCSSLTNLDLSSFNTSNLISMDYMFYECSSLTSLDLSSFNTLNLNRMERTFCGCSSLTSLNLSTFNTSNVTNMQGTFYGCSSLTSLDLSSFNTSNVRDMFIMFSSCSSLTSLDLSSFNTSNVTDMRYMFSNCSSLTSLDLSSFSSNSLTDFSYAFFACYALQAIRFSNSFSLSNSCGVGRALSGVGTGCSTTIKCNSQTKSRLMGADPGSSVVWDLY